jgi:hypothetical protein
LPSAFWILNGCRSEEKKQPCDLRLPSFAFRERGRLRAAFARFSQLEGMRVHNSLQIKSAFKKFCTNASFLNLLTKSAKKESVGCSPEKFCFLSNIFRPPSSRAEAQKSGRKEKEAKFSPRPLRLCASPK